MGKPRCDRFGITTKKSLNDRSGTFECTQRVHVDRFWSPFLLVHYRGLRSLLQKSDALPVRLGDSQCVPGSLVHRLKLQLLPAQLLVNYPHYLPVLGVDLLYDGLMLLQSFLDTGQMV